MLGWRLVPIALAASVTAGTVAREAATEPPALHDHHPHDRKQDASAAMGPPCAVLATLADFHSPARVVLDDSTPTPESFAELVRDPVLFRSHPMDPALLGLLRELARAHPLALIGLVSGYRSPKLNEALRKKGHHVASHSQHSLGHAIDIQIVADGEDAPLEPAVVAREVRALGWTGGVGIYPGKDDRFVHVDTGPNRGWIGK